MAVKDLADYRKQIDAIDEQLIALIAQRRECVEAVAQFKAQNNLSALQPDRFEAVKQRWRKLAADHGVEPRLAESIYVLLHDYFVQLEKDITKR